jgi:hypothetical protein
MSLKAFCSTTAAVIADHRVAHAGDSVALHVQAVTTRAEALHHGPIEP